MDILSPDRERELNVLKYYNRLDPAGKAEFLMNYNYGLYHQNVKNLKLPEEKRAPYNKKEIEFQAELTTRFLYGIENIDGQDVFDIDKCRTNLKAIYKKKYEIALKLGKKQKQHEEILIEDDEVDPKVSIATASHYALSDIEGAENFAWDSCYAGLFYSYDPKYTDLVPDNVNWNELVSSCEKEAKNEVKQGLSEKDKIAFEKGVELSQKEPASITGDYSIDKLNIDVQSVEETRDASYQLYYERNADFGFKNMDFIESLDKFNTQRARIFGRDEKNISKETQEHKELREAAEDLKVAKQYMDKMGQYLKESDPEQYVKYLNALTEKANTLSECADAYMAKKKAIIFTPAGNARYAGARELKDHAARILNDVRIEKQRYDEGAVNDGFVAPDEYNAAQRFIYDEEPEEENLKEINVKDLEKKEGMEKKAGAEVKRESKRESKESINENSVDKNEQKEVPVRSSAP